MFLIGIYSIFRFKIFLELNKYYNWLIIILVWILLIADIEIYRNWGIKINYKAIMYLNEPGEAFRSASKIALVIGVLVISGFSFVSIWVNNRLIFKRLENFPGRKFWFSALWLVLMPGIIFTGMRGGIDGVPITQSRSYFSKSNFVNIVTVNTLWNLGYSIKQNKRYINENPFVFFKMNVAKNSFTDLTKHDPDNSFKLLKTNRPNIVLIILESWTGSFVDDLGNNLHVTPKFSKLVSEGYLFTEHYASGMLSHQGIMAILGGYPSTPLASISKEPSKYQNLPCLGKELSNIGYHTSFHFGGQLEYGNIRAYIVYNQFDDIVEGKDFSPMIPEGALGHHDEFLFQRLLDDVNDYRQPFFAAAFTLSSHSPFDQPLQGKYKKFGEFNRMFTSLYYSDSVLYEFIQNAKKQDWYDNTLFVFVADHSHPSPYQYSYYSKELRKIPLLFYGNVLKDEFKGQKYSELVSQTDIPATLLAQLGLDYTHFEWSRNAFDNNQKRFAYYGFDNGFGWIEPEGNFAWLMEANRLEVSNFKTKADSIKIVRNGKAYLQVLYQNYLDN